MALFKTFFRRMRVKTYIAEYSQFLSTTFLIFFVQSCLKIIFCFFVGFPRCIIAEKKAKKIKAPMADRLMAQALALQMDQDVYCLLDLKKYFIIFFYNMSLKYTITLGLGFKLLQQTCSASATTHFARMDPVTSNGGKREGRGGGADNFLFVASYISKRPPPPHPLSPLSSSGYRSHSFEFQL